MRFVDIIERKKKGFEHTKEEIQFIVDSLMNGTADDYQISAWLMAVYFKGMTLDETANLTRAIIDSGEVIDLSPLRDFCPHVADKHSTGGVGDKITLILIPLLASCGVPIAKLSGRGLGHTGGTIDKLESIPGFKTDLDIEELINKVKEVGLAIASQTARLTPADGRLYALRDFGLYGLFEREVPLSSGYAARRVPFSGAGRHRAGAPAHEVLRSFSVYRHPLVRKAGGLSCLCGEAPLARGAGAARRDRDVSA